MVGLISKLVRLNITAQVLNALLLPLVIAFLVALSLKALPPALRPHGWYLVAGLGISVAACAFGVIGCVAGML